MVVTYYGKGEEEGETRREEEGETERGGNKEGEKEEEREEGSSGPAYQVWAGVTEAYRVRAGVPTRYAGGKGGGRRGRALRLAQWPAAIIRRGLGRWPGEGKYSAGTAGGRHGGGGDFQRPALRYAGGFGGGDR